MKPDPMRLASRFGSNVSVVLATILLLFPSSASVLCIAPAGHIAIEESNAACCASSGISDPAGRQPDNGFDASGNCQNCTDLFMTPYRRGAVSESSDNAAAISLADDFLGNHLSSDASFSPSRLGAINNIDASTSVSSSVPLRC
jgi:hypothetical protein